MKDRAGDGGSQALKATSIKANRYSMTHSHPD